MQKYRALITTYTTLELAFHKSFKCEPKYSGGRGLLITLYCFMQSYTIQRQLQNELFRQGQGLADLCTGKSSPPLERCT